MNTRESLQASAYEYSIAQRIMGTVMAIAIGTAAIGAIAYEASEGLIQAAHIAGY